MSASDAPISKLTVTLGYVFLKSIQKSSASYPAQSSTVRLPVNSAGGASVAGGGAPPPDSTTASASINPCAANSIDFLGFILSPFQTGKVGRQRVDLKVINVCCWPP